MPADMFYGAAPSLFDNARQLRLNMTRAEKLLWNALKSSQLHGFRFRAQHPISIFVADFYCHAARLVVELDGGIHDDADQRTYDENRTYLLTEFGLTVIRFPNEVVYDRINEVLATIAGYLPDREGLVEGSGLADPQSESLSKPGSPPTRNVGSP
jgi:very-short-patch-repair endonuclease